MSKKNKKIYKPLRILAPKVTINNRWVNWRQIETKNRKMNLLSSLKKMILKSLWFDRSDYDTEHNHEIYELALQKKLWMLSKRSSDSSIKNYCHYIGRSRSFNRKMFMARHTLRKFARFGAFPGLIHERI